MNYIDRLNNEINTDSLSAAIRRHQEWHNTFKPENVYKYDTVSKARRIAFICFAIIVFPVGLALLTHRIVGKIIFSGWIGINKHRKAFVKEFASEKYHIKPENPSPYLIAKRIHILVNGTIVDACIMGKQENLNNGKWTLVAPGVGRCMEELDTPVDLLRQQNYLFFNYTGVGASKGLPSKAQIVNSYNAMLHFLEDAKKGIGAKEIICWGRSIGGAIQAEALKNHTFQNQIKYTSISDRTFARLSNVAWYTRILKLLGWEFNCAAASEKLEELGKEEIILQTAHQRPFDLIENPLNIRINPDGLYYDEENPLTAESILYDGTINPFCSLAYSLLSKRTDWKHKKFISVNSDHGHYRLPSLEFCRKMNLIGLEAG